MATPVMGSVGHNLQHPLICSSTNSDPTPYVGQDAGAVAADPLLGRPLLGKQLHSRVSVAGLNIISRAPSLTAANVPGATGNADGNAGCSSGLSHGGLAV